jgi:DNA-directed RNA polymerase specialized sigma24 family protein
VDPEGDFFESIVDEHIMQAIDDLPEEYRMAVVLSDLEGLPYADIAELMEVPTSDSPITQPRKRRPPTKYSSVLVLRREK